MSAWSPLRLMEREEQGKPLQNAGLMQAWNAVPGKEEPGSQAAGSKTRDAQ